MRRRAFVALIGEQEIHRMPLSGMPSILFQAKSNQMLGSSFVR
jgi:hypothetical protein